MKLKKIKRERKHKKIPVMKIGTHKKTVAILWVMLLCSTGFGIYKNFTAIDTHTIHEKEIIEQRVVDTNSIECFVKDFAKVYYTWNNTKESIDTRTVFISKYISKELQALNTDTVRMDIPTCSAVNDVQIWSVKDNGNDFEVIYSVTQTITEGEQSTVLTSSFNVTVHLDSYNNMVITKNPTICSLPEKSDFEPKIKESDSTIDAERTLEITEFLETFFKLYPTITETEITYYVRNNALYPINNDSYVFAGLEKPVLQLTDEQIKAYVTVKYLDTRTKATQISQFSLTLEKGENWVIVD
ncbi:MAG: conjugal transfer protein [Lachnospiraceae bacterium]|nr:conjugal transfer protein [Lachnospiraceae bacterium]